jgi:hypothetical protein
MLWWQGTHLVNSSNYYVVVSIPLLLPLRWVQAPSIRVLPIWWDTKFHTHNRTVWYVSGYPLCFSVRQISYLRMQVVTVRVAALWEESAHLLGGSAPRRWRCPRSHNWNMFRDTATNIRQSCWQEVLQIHNVTANLQRKCTDCVRRERGSATDASGTEASILWSQIGPSPLWSTPRFQLDYLNHRKTSSNTKIK